MKNKTGNSFPLTAKAGGETDVPSTINETLNTVYSRRSVRKYLDKPVSRDLIDQIIDAGRMAPSAMNQQAWKFIVLSDRDDIKSFSGQIAKASLKGLRKLGLKTIFKSAAHMLLHPHDLAFFREKDFIFHGAPVVIFLAVPGDNEWAATDAGACMQNMLLAARSLGLGSCPVGLAKFVSETELIKKFGLKPGEHILLAVILGYADEDPELHERKKDNVLYLHD